jgi:hypothetical protein
LRRTRRLYQDFAEPSHLARLSWLEGRITRDLGLWDSAELKRLAAEMVPTFESRDVHPEALAALALFQKAAAAEQVDRVLLDRIATELRRTAAPAR